ncbi:uncharacterized protein H6S33_005948 [Morchella sextelata]|uniref:uncharacterized protein n=1 Tax=Morchella sextelata TaxID=1174677 RepID=UPI001D05829D|nr:uncharacterized protein H6S33_005948 [Morchella sextelata]KAH0614062.1 hypothetical protein H6S33_005948 [Morchella sextelata]
MLDVDEICRAVDEAGGRVIFEVDDIVAFLKGVERGGGGGGRGGGDEQAGGEKRRQ